MNHKSQAIVGIAAVIGVIVLDELLSAVGIIILIVSGVLVLAAFIWGTRLSLFLRVFTTGMVFYFGYSICLGGRTMEPGFTFYTVKMALLLFFLYAIWPSLALLRIWRGRTRVAIVSSILPFSLLAAALVAGIEEQMFIKKYRSTGVGVTKRWTVSHHWLSYDKEAQRLDGSD